MVVMKSVCPVCDSNDYVLRQGQYFCSMCNTQSQELGMETVMDDETIPLEVQGRNNAITVGKGRKGKGKKRNLCDEVRWGTAEGYSWVLRGWVDRLKSVGVHVEMAVIQLWTLYMRKLKMGFEKMGEKGMMGTENMKYRDKWNIINGPPGILDILTLAAGKRRRMAVEEEGLGEDVEYGEETLQERKIRSKKRRSFYKSVSGSDIGSEGDPKSPSARSSQCESGLSSGAVSEDEFSDSGYMTDPTLFSRVMERFVPREKRSVKDKFNNLKRMRRDSNVKEATCLPILLNMKMVAALMTLAVVGRPTSTLTMADMVSLFNKEALAWRSAFAFLPKIFVFTTSDKINFSGQQVVFSTNMMSVLVFRLASFLHQSDEQQISLAFSPVKRSEAESENKSQFPQTFKSILARVLADLSLPSVLRKDISSCCQRLHLTSLSATLQPYTPDNKTARLWATNKFPLVSKRVLALILFSLKYHCGLDDQYEVYMSHNIKKMATLDVGSDINYFDILSWVRLSKLRLDHLMSTSHSAREQYQPLSHVGTPGLVLTAVLAKLIEDDCGGGDDQGPGKKCSDLAKLMAELSVKVKPLEHSQLCLQPLLENTQALLGCGAAKPVLRKSMEKLLAMNKAEMRLYFEMKACNLRRILHASHGVSVDPEFKKKVEKKVKLDKNWIVTPGTHGHPCRIKTEKHLKKQMKKQFAEMISSGRSRKSKVSVPQPKLRPGNLFRVTNKVYWFAHHYTLEQLAGRGAGRHLQHHDKEVVSDQMLDTLPSNFAWILKYLACYAHLPPMELLEEVNEIEKLILSLDPDFFGLPKKLKPKRGGYRVPRVETEKDANINDLDGE